jgi:hypothetical protein
MNGLDLFGPVVGVWKCSKEYTGSIKVGKFIDQFYDHLLC